MSFPVANTKVKIRYLTDVNWASSQVRLADGEPGYDIVNNILKIGLGNKLWADLPPIGSSGGSSGGGTGSIVAVLQSSLTTELTTFNSINTDLATPGRVSPSTYVPALYNTIYVSGNDVPSRKTSVWFADSYTVDGKIYWNNLGLITAIPGPAGPTGPTGETGPQGPSGAAGTGGGGTSTADTETMVNIGLNRYINRTTLNATYFPASGSSRGYISFIMRVYGNSSQYRFAFSYSPALTTHLYPSLGSPSTTYIYPPGASNSTTVSTFYNNSNSGGIFVNTIFYVADPTSTTTYTVTLITDTTGAGGIGNGSSATSTATVQLRSGDTMGPPVVSATPGIGNLSMAPVNTRKYSGVEYYGNGSRLLIPANYFTIYNLYNLSGDYPFPYVAINLSEGQPAYTTDTTTNLSVSGSFPSVFPAPGGNSDTRYKNIGALSVTITSLSNTHSLYFNSIFTNALSDTTNLIPLYPPSGTTLAYFGNAYYDEITLQPNNSGKTTNSFILTQQRMSLANDSSVVSFNSNILSIFDAAYSPLTTLFYSTGFNALFNGVQTVSRQSFTEGSKYLVFRLTFGTSPLRLFNIYLNSSQCTIGSIFVRWTKIVSGSSSVIGDWFDSSIDRSLTGGCQASSYQTGQAYGFWPIEINTAYTNAFGSYTSAYIDVKILINSGTIPFGSVVFT